MGCLKAHDLKRYIAGYKINTFIETGTGVGDSLRYASSFNFETLFSIEIVKELYDELVFNDERITVCNTDSISGLNRILTTRVGGDGVVLFWLDAHLPGVDYHVDGYSPEDRIDKAIKFPLEAELEQILSVRDISMDVVIIDDLRLYSDEAFWDTSLGNSLIEKWRQDYSLDSLFSTLEKIKKTHDVTTDTRDQGYLILTPKA